MGNKLDFKDYFSEIREKLKEARSSPEKASEFFEAFFTEEERKEIEERFENSEQ